MKNVIFLFASLIFCLPALNAQVSVSYSSYPGYSYNRSNSCAPRDNRQYERPRHRGDSYQEPRRPRRPRGHHHQEPQRQTYAQPMSRHEFASAVHALDAQRFESTRFTLTKQIFGRELMTSAQVREVMGLFSFEKGRLEVAEFCYGKVVDPDRYYMVNDMFSFSSSVEHLSHFIASQPVYESDYGYNEEPDWRRGNDNW
ncbi:DUF4476 domain-containing protein [bacterium]|nr:DUF4476 domain-containing protein [bacterium]